MIQFQVFLLKRSHHIISLYDKFLATPENRYHKIEPDRGHNVRMLHSRHRNSSDESGQAGIPLQISCCGTQRVGLMVHPKWPNGQGLLLPLIPCRVLLFPFPRVVGGAARSNSNPANTSSTHRVPRQTRSRSVSGGTNKIHMNDLLAE